MIDDGDPGSVSTEARRALEAIVMAATDPVPSQLLAQLLEVSVEAVEGLCEQLAAEYEATARGFQLARIAGGWRYQTHPDLYPYVERFAMDGQAVRLSSAALETLAIVAYKQPISRAQVSAIRGVNVDAVLRTLEQRGYVHEVGRDTGAGQAVLFGTTPFFLERLGLDTLDDLPALGDFVPAAEVVEALEMSLKVGADDEVADDEVDADDEVADDEVAVDSDEVTVDSEDAESVADGEVGEEPEVVDEGDVVDEPEVVGDAEATVDGEVADQAGVDAEAGDGSVSGDGPTEGEADGGLASEEETASSEDDQDLGADTLAGDDSSLDDEGITAEGPPASIDLREARVDAAEDEPVEVIDLREPEPVANGPEPALVGDHRLVDQGVADADLRDPGDGRPDHPAPLVLNPPTFGDVGSTPDSGVGLEPRPVPGPVARSSVVSEPNDPVASDPDGQVVAPQAVEPEPVAEEPEPIAEQPEPEPVAEEPELEPIAEEPEPEPVAEESELVLVVEADESGAAAVVGVGAAGSDAVERAVAGDQEFDGGVEGGDAAGLAADEPFRPAGDRRAADPAGWGVGPDSPPVGGDPGPVASPVPGHLRRPERPDRSERPLTEPGDVEPGAE